MKRILSLDGGGIRGVFTLQILRRIEAIFRQRARRNDLVLADAFDLFAGTSTGAIIATCLCAGMSVDAIEKLYLEQSTRMFTRSPWFRRFSAKYTSAHIAELFKEIMQEPGGSGLQATLGSSRLRKLLMVMTRNATTGSPWPLTNNPHAMFNDRARPDCNLDIPLWQLLRASTAAPTYFAPEAITLGGQTHLFVDGGVTPYNNPAFMAFCQATLPPYRIGWPASRHDLHVISVGTGQTRARLPGKTAARITILDQLGFIPPAIIGSAMLEQDMLCRLVGDCVHGEPLDAELGALLEPTLFNADEQKFTYARYDTRVDAHDGVTILPRTVRMKLDDLRLIPHLQEIGRAYADEHVRDQHMDARGEGAPACAEETAHGPA